MKYSLCFVITLLAANISLGAEAPGPQSRSGRPTERPSAEEVAALKSGPPLPYQVDTNWPNLPAGYNLGEATGIDLDAEGNVWVLNRGAWPVMQFDREGNLLQSWSNDTLSLLSEHGLRVGPEGNIWAVDVSGHIILKLDTAGRILMLLGQRQGVAGNNDAQDAFNRPTAVSFRANGNVYIADGYVNGRIVEYSADGDYLRHWGSRGEGDGQFNLVHDVTVDNQGRVYVADRSNERIQVFSADGKFLTKWTDIGAPWGVEYVERENAIYMCDGTYARIIKLSLDGEVLGVLSSYGRAPGKVDYVHAIAVDPRDLSIYTTEIKTWRVQKWVRTAN